VFLFWGRSLWRNSLFDVEGQFYLYLVSGDGTGQQMDVLVVVVVAPRPEDVDGLRHETMHNSGQCCGSGRTCYGAGRMSKALRTGVAFGLKVGRRQAQREKGSSPTLDVNGCCCSFVWVGRCVASQVPNWPAPTFVAIEHRVQPPDCHFRPTRSVPGRPAYGSLFLFRRRYPLNRYLFQNLLWPYMIFKIFLSPYQVVDPVEPHPLMRPVRYLLPDPGGSHQFAQLVFTYSADWWNW